MQTLRSIAILPSLLLALLIVSPAAAQKSATLKVTVLDSANRQPLERASVSILSPRKGAYTNSSGEATIHAVAYGSYTLRVKYVGYLDRDIAGVVVKDSIVQLTVTLSVNTKDPERHIEISSRETKDGKSKRYEGAEGDVIEPSSSGDPFGMFSGGSRRAPSMQGSYMYQTENTEEYKSGPENTYKLVTTEPLSTFSIDVDRASYANVRRFLTGNMLPPADAVRVEEMINYFHYDLPKPEGKDPIAIFTDMAACPWNEKHRIVQVSLKGREIEKDNLPPANLVFLIDVSGSMNSPEKLPLLKSAFRLLVEQLREEDKVSIVTYAGNAGLVLPATSGSEKAKILQAIDQLTPGGSTAGAAGIQLAYQIAKDNKTSKNNSRVILATDGDFNVGISRDDELIKFIEAKRDQGIFLTVMGFGTGNYKDAKMEQLADKGNGNYAYCDNLLEAQKTFVTELGGTLTTIAKDVKIQIEFNPRYVQAYRLIGYENRMLNKEDFNNDKKDAGELGAGHEVTALYEIVPTGVENDPALVSVDPLKYQQAFTPALRVIDNNEMMTVKFRYKDPADSVSKLVTKVMMANESLRASDNLRWSMAVAQFGMLLRGSEYKGNANIASVQELANASKGNDAEGYRAEFIRMLKMYELLSKNTGSNE
jgi:Ca-activated chloride channel homolog